jgi:AraC family transcriptional regulator
MMSYSVGEFGVKETHGILMQPANELRASSDGFGWRSIYASMQREAPYQASFSAVKDYLIILHLDGPVGVQRALGASKSHRIIRPGGLFMLPGGMDFGVRLEGHLESLHLYVRAQVLEEVANDFGLKPGLRPELVARLGVRDPVIEQLVLSVRDQMMEQDPFSHIYTDYIARLLAAHLLRKHSTLTAAHKKAAPSMSRVQVERAIEYMESHLADSISLADVADAANLSPSHFTRLFKSATGAPPHQFLIQLRVERAKRMLMQRGPIAEVALACGFAHQEHLTRIFRRTTGFTPASFRRAGHA